MHHHQTICCQPRSPPNGFLLLIPSLSQSILQAILLATLTASLTSGAGRQGVYQGQVGVYPTRGNPRPAAQYGGQGQGSDTGGLGDLLDGIELNLLDAKLIGLGFVREDLVKELCGKATQQVVREGVRRIQSEAGTAIANLSSTVDARCKMLITEGEVACGQVMGMITQRFDTITQEVVREGEEQCQKSQKLVVEMIKKGAKSAFESQLELGKQLAEAEFRKQVEQQKNRGERMFQEEIEKNRVIGEKELRRRIEEGRGLAENNFTQEVKLGKEKAEEEYQQTIVDERARAEAIFQKRVAEERAQAEKVFQDRVAKGREEAEKAFREEKSKAEIEGEKRCTEMINIACQNVTVGSESDDFCEEFFFFTGDLDDGKRIKRQNHHLYGSFYDKVSPEF